MGLLGLSHHFSGFRTQTAASRTLSVGQVALQPLQRNGYSEEYLKVCGRMNGNCLRLCPRPVVNKNIKPCINKVCAHARAHCACPGKADAFHHPHNLSNSILPERSCQTM